VANQNFRVKTGLEVGTGVTISAGIVTATSFIGNITGNVSGNINSTGVSTFATANITQSNPTNLNVSGVSTFAGITTVTGITLFSKQLNVSGVSTIGNTVVGGATTQLIVNGDARITGILTIGTSSVTFDGTNNSVTIGTGVTIFGNTGIISATEFRGNGANLTGVFPQGTLMLFQQTSAPTGWTKQTTHNDKTLRVVSGSASSGGSTAFTSVFASRTPTGSVSGSNSGGSVTGSVSGSNSGGSVTGSVSGSNSGGSVSNTTLTESQIPSHTHTINNGTLVRRNVPGANFASGGAGYGEPNDLSNTSTGGGGAHSHGFTNPTWSGSWTQGVFTNPSWSGSWTQGVFTNPSWSGSFSGSAMDFAVQYVDLIIASKN